VSGPDAGRAAVERAILEVTGRQHGVATRAQLLAAGLGPSAVDHRVAAGRLVAVYRGVYRVGPPVATWGREMAAVLACGPASALSHGSAACLLPILGDRRPPEVVEVTVWGGSRKRDGVRVHRVRDLPTDEITRVEGIPVTTPGRTIIDLAGVLDARELERAVIQAMALRETTRAKLLALTGRYPRRRGVARLRAILAPEAGPARTRSKAEEVFLKLIRDAGLRDPEVNVIVAGHRVDFVWRTERVVVEIDGITYHSLTGRIEADRLRDADLADAGFRVLRITWRRLQEKPLAALASVIRALDRAGQAR
jgi:very-short-patch-repair endonuclease